MQRLPFNVFRIPDLLASIRQLEACIDEVDTWMLTNRLRLNDDKTYILFTGTRTLLREIPLSTVGMGDADIVHSDVICSLGVMCDSVPQINACHLWVLRAPHSQRWYIYI